MTAITNWGVGNFPAGSLPSSGQPMSVEPTTPYFQAGQTIPQVFVNWLFQKTFGAAVGYLSSLVHPVAAPVTVYSGSIVQISYNPFFDQVIAVINNGGNLYYCYSNDSGFTWPNATNITSITPLGLLADNETGTMFFFGISSTAIYGNTFTGFNSITLPASPDSGLCWKTCSTGIGAGKNFALFMSNGSVFELLTSPDLINWTNVTSTHLPASIQSMNTTYVPCVATNLATGQNMVVFNGSNYGSTPQSLYMYSPDGTNWTVATQTAVSGTVSFIGVCYSATLNAFFSVMCTNEGMMSPQNSPFYILTSTDGMTWQFVSKVATFGASSAIQYVNYMAENSGVLYIASTQNGGEIQTTGGIYSIDGGLTWHACSLGNTVGLTGLANCGGRLIATISNTAQLGGLGGLGPART